MRHRAFTRDIVLLVGGAFTGFELNLVVQNAQDTILAKYAPVWIVLALLLTAGFGYWLERKDERRLSRPVWVGKGTPYPGLQPFREGRAGVFFGRDEEINELARRLVSAGKAPGSRFIALVGASGGGKSSLLQAGLKPRLESTGDWTVLGPVTPGSQPVDVLAAELGRAAPALAGPEELARFTRQLRRAAGLPSGRAGEEPNSVLAARIAEVRGGGRQSRLLIIDQLEEIFTLASPNERDAFLACLGQLLAEDRDLHIVAALRSEFLTEFLAGPSAWLMRDPYVLPGMDDAGLKAAIVGPARQAGITFDDGVVEEMLGDAKGGDGLPLLAYLLRELCPGEPDGLRVSRAAYRATGGVAAALRRQADAALRRLSERYEAEEVLDTLLGFVTLEGAEPTRRRVVVTELTEAQRDIVDDFVEARLLVSVDSTVDIAHEAMLRQWEPLRLAISRQEDALRRRTDIEPHAREWDREGRRDDFLLQGERLREVQTWLSDPAFGVTPLLREFVEVSARRVDAHARDTADVVAGHALRLLPTYPELATALAHAAVVDCSPTQFAQYALARALDAPLRRVRHRGAALRALDRSDDGDFAAACADGAILVWSADATAPKVLPTGGDPLAVAWSPSGDLAVGMADGTVRVWPAGATEPVALRGPDDRVTAVSWSPDGQLSCLALSGAARTWRRDLAGHVDHAGTDSRGQTLAWSRGGVLAVGHGDGSVRLHQPGADPVVVPTHGGRVLSLAWSATGLLAVGSTDGLVRVLDADGAELARLSGHGGRALSVAWSPDGVLASGSDNGEIHVWRSELEAPAVLCGHRGSVWALRWSDATDLVSVGEDGAILEWSSGPGDQILLTREDHRIPGVAWSPRGELAQTSNKAIKVWSGDGARLRELSSGDSEAWAVGWSADGSLAAGSADGTVRLWRPGAEEPEVWRAHEAGVWSVAFSADGRLATGSNDGTVRVWATPGGEPSDFAVGDVAVGDVAVGDVAVGDVALGDVALGDVALGDVEVWTVAWSPDGKLAAGADDGAVRVWRPGAAEPVLLRAGESPVWIVGWSPDGRLAASSGDGVVRVWDRALDRDPLLLDGHGKGAWSVAWSDDGRLAAGAGDGTIRIWRPDTDDGPIDVAAHRDGIWLVAWSPDGRLASSSEDNSVRITRLPVLDTRALLTRFDGCGFRGLTDDERRRYHLPVR